MTTPDADELQRRLRVLADQGIEHVFLEVSSQGLDQQRIGGLRIRLAAFTQLGRDHLDYHGTATAYRQAKQRLFLEYRPQAAVITLMIRLVPNLRENFSGRVLRVACEGMNSADLSVREVQPISAGLRLELDEGEARFGLTSGLYGCFNAANLALAWGILTSLGIDGEEAAGLCRIVRLRRVAWSISAVGPLPDAFVDYAHTPEALGAVLGNYGPASRTVCGASWDAAGERDTGKRAEMGRVAGSLSNELFITSDNPRGEDPQEIAEQVLAGVSGQAVMELDRGRAIREALHSARPGDIVLVAGKGHESFQVSGGRVLPFSDASAVREALASYPRATG